MDDWRNTDHAWMETNAVHYHATDEVAKGLSLRVTDTAEIRKSAWYAIEDVSTMYASHIQWLKKVKFDLKSKLYRPAQQNAVDIADSTTNPKKRKASCDDQGGEKVAKPAPHTHFVSHVDGGGF